MESASNTLPDQPLNDVTAGIDWARDDHAVCIVDGRGREVARTMVEHTATGLRDLIAFLGRHGVDEVAIERPDGPVIDTLRTDRPRLRRLEPDAYDPTRHHALQRVIAAHTAAA